jgi:predicted aconitase with swiveling domain
MMELTKGSCFGSVIMTNALERGGAAPDDLPMATQQALTQPDTLRTHPVQRQLNRLL